MAHGSKSAFSWCAMRLRHSSRSNGSAGLASAISKPMNVAHWPTGRGSRRIRPPSQASLPRLSAWTTAPRCGPPVASVMMTSLPPELTAFASCRRRMSRTRGRRGCCSRRPTQRYFVLIFFTTMVTSPQRRAPTLWISSVRNLPKTGRILRRFAGLRPKTLAVHGSSYVGDGAQAIEALIPMLKDVVGGL